VSLFFFLSFFFFSFSLSFFHFVFFERGISRLASVLRMEMEPLEGEPEPKSGQTFDEMLENVQQTEEWKRFFESFVSSLPKTSTQEEQEVPIPGENIDIVDEEWAKTPSKCIDHMDVFISEKSEEPLSLLLDEKVSEAADSVRSNTITLKHLISAVLSIQQCEHVAT
jgi:hypothetical protein